MVNAKQKSPFLLAFFGQFIPIGILSPIYLFFAYVLSPPQKFASPAARAISPVHAVAVLPTIVLAYYVPHFPCFFHESHAARNWWNWVWQLYPVWGSAMFFIWTKILAVGVASKSSRSIIRPSLSVLAAINTATYWYTIYNSEVPLAEVYIPKYFIHAPVDPVVAMRTIIQYDYICCFSAALLWLAFLIRDLKASGEVKLSWVVILGLTVVVSGVCGAGTMLLLGWAWRDEVLAKGADETAKNK